MTGRRPTVLRRVAVILLCVPLLLAILLGVMLLLDRGVYEVETELYPKRYEALVSSAANRYGVPVSVIYGVMRTESGFDEGAVSHAGAIGLMQITPDTYDWIYFLRGESADPDTIANPAHNIDAGVSLLAWLYARYGRWDTVYAAYNAGYARVNGWLSDPAISEDGVLVHIPIAETESYVRVVTETEAKYRALYPETADAVSTAAPG